MRVSLRIGKAAADSVWERGKDSQIPAAPRACLPEAGRECTAAAYDRIPDSDKIEAETALADDTAAAAMAAVFAADTAAAVMAASAADSAAAAAVSAADRNIPPAAGTYFDTAALSIAYDIPPVPLA